MSNAKNNKKTIDIYHTNKICNFENNIKELSKLENELKNEQIKLKDLINKKETSNEIINIKNNIIVLENKIKEYKCNNELKYLINTGDILFNYYNIVDNGDIADMNYDNDEQNNGILNFFIKKKQTDNKNISYIKDKLKLSNEYLEIIDNNYIKENIEKYKDNCPCCNSLNRDIIIADGIIYCNDCFTIEYIIVDHDRPTYKDPPREISYFSYKRLNHFNEWLSQIQGKETTDIPNEIYEKIMLEIKKEKINNMSLITPKKMKTILKKLKLSKYYEHCSHIVTRINGIQTPQFSPELEDKLRSMFKQIQPLFNKYAPSKRKNFLSYSYVIYKMLELLEEDNYLKYFLLLKSREKLQSQDNIWELLCKDLQWQFIKKYMNI